MDCEIQALHDNDTWELPARPSNASTIGKITRLFRLNSTLMVKLIDIKLDWWFNVTSKSTGSIMKRLLRHCKNNNNSQLLVAQCAAKQWSIIPMDGKIAFICVVLNEIVYMHYPWLYYDLSLIFHLERSHYRLKQATRAWCDRFSKLICQDGFTQTKHDFPLFT